MDLLARRLRTATLWLLLHLPKKIPCSFLPLLLPNGAMPCSAIRITSGFKQVPLNIYSIKLFKEFWYHVPGSWWRCGRAGPSHPLLPECLPPHGTYAAVSSFTLSALLLPCEFSQGPSLSSLSHILSTQPGPSTQSLGWTKQTGSQPLFLRTHHLRKAPLVRQT